jgi:O-methyltransferase
LKRSLPRWFRDEDRRLRVLRLIGKRLLPNYRYSWPQIAWWRDPEFNAYLARFDDSEEMNAQRHWALYQLLRLVAEIPGDTAECGVFRGASSYLICSAIKSANQPRTHFVFDSFEGLSEPSAHDGDHWSRGAQACDLETAQRNLRKFDNVSWHKGWIPDRFADAEGRCFAFVHIDVDLHQPTRDSMQFFYPRMNKGGIILCDDYGFTSCPGATRAIDVFLADKPEKMIALSSGGGFMIAGRRTAERASLSG